MLHDSKITFMVRNKDARKFDNWFCFETQLNYYQKVEFQYEWAYDNVAQIFDWKMKIRVLNHNFVSPPELENHIKLSIFMDE